MFDWNQESVNDLRRMCAEGRSGGEIAREFGITRNMIIGKAKRMGFALNPHSQAGTYRGLRRGPGKRPPRPRKPDKLAPPGPGYVKPIAKPKPEPKPKPGPAPLASDPCTLIELTATRCRFPLWEHDGSGERLFCGGATLDKLPYCEHHARMVYEPARSKP